MAPPIGFGVGGTRSAQQAGAPGRELDQPHLQNEPAPTTPHASRSLPRKEGARRQYDVQGQAIPKHDQTRPAGRWLQAPPWRYQGGSGRRSRLKQQGPCGPLSLEFKLPPRPASGQAVLRRKPTPASSASPLRAIAAIQAPGIPRTRRPSGRSDHGHGNPSSQRP